MGKLLLLGEARLADNEDKAASEADEYVVVGLEIDEAPSTLLFTMGEFFRPWDRGRRDRNRIDLVSEHRLQAGVAVLVKNRGQKLGNEAGEYWFAWVHVADQNAVPMFFTDHEIKIGSERALRQPEDVPTLDWMPHDFYVCMGTHLANIAAEANE